MSCYRRACIPGACYFFTVVTYQRNPLFDNESAVKVLREAFRAEIQRRPFEVEAAVVLPDHLHCIWRLPEGDADFSSRWREIKKYVSQNLEGVVVNTRGEGNVWQRRFWEHVIRDDQDYQAHVDYIHYNPVKHGYVSLPGDWPWSSFNRWVDAGCYSADWGRTEPGSIGLMEME